WRSRLFTGCYNGRLVGPEAKEERTAIREVEVAVDRLLPPGKAGVDKERPRRGVLKGADEASTEGRAEIASPRPCGQGQRRITLPISHSSASINYSNILMQFSGGVHAAIAYGAACCAAAARSRPIA